MVVISVAQRQRVTMSIIEADYDPMIHLRAECDDPASELFCNDDANGLNSEISEVLEPGTYFLYLDGWLGRFGSGRLQVVMGGAGGGNQPPPPPGPGPDRFPPE